MVSSLGRTEGRVQGGHSAIQNSHRMQLQRKKRMHLSKSTYQALGRRAAICFCGVNADRATCAPVQPARIVASTSARMTADEFAFTFPAKFTSASSAFVNS